MQIPFVTISKNQGLKQGPLCRSHSLGGASPTGIGPAEEAHYSLVFNKVRDLLKQQGDPVQKILVLRHDDKGFGNKVLLVVCQQQSYVLKILGQTAGFRREIFTWKVLGYASDGLRRGPRVPGFPTRVYPFPELNAVLLPYYSGQLAAMPSNSHELPMVLAMILYLSRTLAGLHQAGLIFMDLCPANILFNEYADRPVPFFLADMGSVKLMQGFQGTGEDWSALQAAVTAARLTRGEILPPEDFFPPLADPQCELPGYDYHTLARTAMLLLGQGAGGEGLRTEGLSASFNLEQPMAARRQELQALYAQLQKPLQGKAFDEVAVEDLLCCFLRDRARFAATLAEGELKRYWIATMLNRLNRFRMALSCDWRALKKELEELASQGEVMDLQSGLDDLQSLPQKLCNGDYLMAMQKLRTLEGSPLLAFSPTAAYSYAFHRKLLKTLARRVPEVQNYFQETADLGESFLDCPPERDTLAALRRNPSQSLCLLFRPFFEVVQ